MNNCIYIHLYIYIPMYSCTSLLAVLVVALYTIFSAPAANIVATFLLRFCLFAQQKRKTFSVGAITLFFSPLCSALLFSSPLFYFFSFHFNLYFFISPLLAFIGVLFSVSFWLWFWFWLPRIISM